MSELDQFQPPVGEMPAAPQPTFDESPAPFQEQQSGTADWYQGGDETSEVGSAADSFQDDTVGSAKIPEYIALERAGLTLNFRKDRQKVKKVLQGAQGLLFQLGSGVDLGHNAPYYQMSQVFLLEKAQQDLMQTILNSKWPGKYKVFGCHSAYGDCNGGIVDLGGLKVSIWDSIVNGVNANSPAFAQFTNRSNARFMGKSPMDKKDPKPLTFKDGRYPRQPYMYLDLKQVHAVPTSVTVPPVEDSAPGRVLRMTTFMSMSWSTFIRAFAVVFAHKHNLNVKELIQDHRPMYEAVQQMWISMTQDTVQTSYGPMQHPRFHAATKAAYGLSLYDGLCSPEMSVAKNPALAPAKLPQEEIETLWKGMAGSQMVVSPSSGQYAVQEAPGNDPRKYS